MLAMPFQVKVSGALTLFGDDQLWLERLAEVLIDSRIGASAGLQLRSPVDPEPPIDGNQPSIKGGVMDRTCSYAIQEVQPLPVVTGCPGLDMRCNKKLVTGNGPWREPAETAAMGKVI